MATTTPDFPRLRQSGRVSHARLVGRISNTPAGGFRESLARLESVARPLERALKETERAVRVGSAQCDLQSRRLDLGYRLAAGGTYASGAAIEDLEACGFDISGATVFWNGNVLCDDLLYVNDFRSAPSNWSETGFWAKPVEAIGFYDFDEDDCTCVVDTAGVTAIVPDTRAYFYFASNHSSSNFGHFVYDTLAQLYAYDRLRRMLAVELIPVLTGPFRDPIQQYLFEGLVAGAASAVFIPHGRGLRVGRCYTASLALPDPVLRKVSVASFQYLRQQILAFLGRQPGGTGAGPERIYIDERGGTLPAPNFRNLRQAEFVVEKQGFVPVAVTGMPGPQVLSTFRNCRWLAGVHGAGLLYSILSREVPSIVEICDFPDSWHIIAIAAWAFGFPLQRVRALPPSPTGGGLPDVDLAALDQVLTGTAAASRAPASQITQASQIMNARNSVGPTLGRTRPRDSEGFGSNVEVLLSAIYHRIVSPVDTVIDGGANGGLHAIPLGQLIRGGGRLYAYEPHPEVFLGLSKWIESSGLADVVCLRNVALGRSSGEAGFYLHKTNAALSSARIMSDAAADWVETRVPMVRLDDERIVPRCSFIKLDWEGGERDALFGARGLVARDRPVIAFENGLKWSALRFGYDVMEFFAFFEDLGYQVYDFTGEQVLRENVSEKEFFWEFVAFHSQDHHAAVILDTIREFNQRFFEVPPAANWEEIMRRVQGPFETGFWK